MLLLIRLRVPQTSPVRWEGGQTHYRRSDIKRNKEERKPPELTMQPPMRLHVGNLSESGSTVPSVAVHTQKCVVYDAIIRTRPSLMSRRRNLFTGAQLIWIASRPATVCRH